MIILPTPPVNIDQTERSYLLNLVKALRDSLAAKVQRNTPEQAVYLVSPNKTVYTVTVSDAGVLTTTKVKDP